MKTCLVVDDSKLVRLVARKMLSDLPFEVVEASSGKEALELCRIAMPDAVLLDWNMPEMNGIEFLEEMRSQPGGREPLVLFCTTENDDAHFRQAVDAGADECVMKPYNGAAIRSRLARVGLPA